MVEQSDILLGVRTPGTTMASLPSSPAVTSTTPSTPSTPSVVTSDLTARETELKEAITSSEKVAAGKIPTIPGVEQFGPKYWKSIEDIKAKLEAIESQKTYAQNLESAIKEGGYTINQEGIDVPLTPELVDQLITESRQQVIAITTPFATEGVIDVVTALKANIAPEVIASWGVSIKTIKAQKALLPYRGDYVKAIREGHIEEIRALFGTTEKGRLAIVDLQSAAADAPIIKAQEVKYEAQIKDFESSLPNLPKVLQDAYRSEGVEGYNEAVFQLLASSVLAAKNIESFAKSKGVDPKDFVSLYNAGLNIDTLKAAYPGNATYFNSITITLKALKPYTKATTTSGVFMMAPGTPRPTTYLPDFVAALGAGVVTVAQLKQLGYDPTFVDNTQKYVNSLDSLVSYLDKGTKLGGKDLTLAENMNLGTAMKEIGIAVPDKTDVTWIELTSIVWKDLTDEQKRQVSQIYASYAAPTSGLVSLTRSLSQAAIDPSLPMPARVAAMLAISPFVAMATPFTKNTTVGDLQEQLNDYTIKNLIGDVIGYDLTKYTEDHPYNAQLLVSGGFKPEEVEKAQKGDKVTASPEGATPLDWLIAGAIAATFVLPIVRAGAWSLGTKLIQPTMTPGIRMGAMAAAQIVYKGTAIGELALKVGFPAGMTITDIINWDKWTPEQRIIAGAFTGLSYIPLLLPIVRSGLQGLRLAKTVTTEGGLAPRALTTGYKDLWPVRVPPEYFEHFTPVQWHSLAGLKGTALVNKAASFMTPETAQSFRSVIKLTDSLKDYSVPESMYRGLEEAYENVSGMNPEAAKALATWMRNNADKYELVTLGSVADYLQGFDIIPKDLDFNTSGSKDVAATVKAQIMRILKTNGATTELDVHTASQFSRQGLPYGWKRLQPIKVSGIMVQPIAEQFMVRAQNALSPGVSKAKGLMGPQLVGLYGKEGVLAPKDFPDVKLGTHEGRVKDIVRYQVQAQKVINLTRESGQIKHADEMQELLDNFRNYSERLGAGKLEPLPPDVEKARLETVIELVKELQYQTLLWGKDIAITDPNTGNILSKVVSPIGKIIPGTVFFAVKDLRPNIQMLQTSGKWKPTEEQVFFSPEIAYDFLIDRTTGELGAHAGVIAVRTVPSVDIGSGKTISGPFRVEYIEGKPVIYNELISGSEFYATEPNIRALSLKGISGGITGEGVTYYPRTRTEVPILWTRTEAAKRTGLGAPSKAKALAIHKMTFEAMLGDLLHPHISKITTNPDVPHSLRTSLVEFYRDTYKWKTATPKELAIEAQELPIRAQKQAIQNLASKGKEPTEANLYDETASIIHQDLVDKVSAVAKGLGKEVPKDLNAFISEQLNKSEIPTVSEIEGMLGMFDIGTQNKTAKDALKAYDKATKTVLTDVKDSFTGLTTEKLYYLNLGKLSTKLALAALATSMLSIPAGAVSTEFVAPIATLSKVLPPASEPSATSIAPRSSSVITTPSPITPITDLHPTALHPTVTTPTRSTSKPIKSALTPTLTPAMAPPALIPPTQIPTTPKARPILLPGVKEVGKKKKVKIPEGSISWRQGRLKGGDVIKYISPPYDQLKPFNLIGQTPIGWKEQGRTPNETLQIIGTAKKVPKSILIDLGFSDILIINGKTIQFAGGGLVTDVGTRLPSPTRGMSAPEAPSGMDALPLGSSFAEFIRRVPKDKAQKDFMLARMSEYMGKMTSKEIASEVRIAQDEGHLKPSKRVLSITLEDILKRLPDLERGNIKLEQLEMQRETVLAPQFRKTVPISIQHKFPREKPSSALASTINLKGLTEL